GCCRLRRTKRKLRRRAESVNGSLDILSRGICTKGSTKIRDSLFGSANTLTNVCAQLVSTRVCRIQFDCVISICQGRADVECTEMGPPPSDIPFRVTRCLTNRLGEIADCTPVVFFEKEGGCPGSKGEVILVIQGHSLGGVSNGGGIVV